MTARETSAAAESRLLAELKTRARLRLNAARRDAASVEPRLRDCLHEVARAVGFADWEHARRILGGEAVAGDDMGTFWYAPGCAALLSVWCASPVEARAAFEVEGARYLLPYRRQFVVADADFIVELGLDPADPAWAATRRDLVASYGSAAWQALAWRRLAATRGP